MTKAKVHGNKIEIDYAALDALMQFKLTKAFVSDYFKVSEDTLEKRIKEKYNMTYSEFGKLRQQGVARKLQQKALEMALGGDRTMLIFALKNMAHWADKVEESIDVKAIAINIDKHDSNL